MKVIKKQTNSQDCIICGIKNELGLKAPFYEMEDGTLWTKVTYKSKHQSYPGRVHGGMITCLLDELIGRAIWIKEPDMWGVTMSINVKFRKPVPYDEELKGIGKIIESKKRTFTGTGEIYAKDGTLLAEAEAVYFKLPLDKISEGSHASEVNVLVPDDVKELD